MRKFLNLFAFGTLAVAAVLLAGCGSTDTGDTGAGSSTTTTDVDDDAGDSDTSSTTGTSGEYQLVSLNVPNMT